MGEDFIPNFETGQHRTARFLTGLTRLSGFPWAKGNKRKGLVGASTNVHDYGYSSSQ